MLGKEKQNQLRIATGIVKHPDGLWQTWVLNPDDTISFFTAHTDEADAIRVRDELFSIFESKDESKLDSIPALLQSKYKVNPFPADRVRVIQKEALSCF